MEYLRLFENYKSDEEIHRICERYKIKNYTINKDGSIDVNGSVLLKKINLTELPLVFNEVSGYFDCSSNKLTSLKGSPRIVHGGDFICNRNNLTNLMGGPEKVNGWYVCTDNRQLTSLEGISKSINGTLMMTRCDISDFNGISSDLYVDEIKFKNNPVYDNLESFLTRYYIDIENIKNKYLDLILEINELDAIQDGKIVDIRMDEVLYNIGLI